MGILDIFSRKADAKSNFFKILWTQAPKREKVTYAESFHKSQAFDNLEMIADDVASIDLKLYIATQYKKDKTIALEQYNYILDVFENPCPANKEIDFYTLKYLTVVYRALVGEFFWILERNGSKISAIYPCPPQWVNQRASVNYHFFDITTFGVTSGQPKRIPANDVIWFKNVDIVDPFGEGRGRSEAIAEEVDIDEYAAKLQKNLLFNDGTPPIIISAIDMDSDSLEQMASAWDQKRRGYNNKHKPAFLNSKVDVKELSRSPVELDMNESRKNLRDFFNAHFCIPPEMRGIIENSNRATIDSADYLYKSNVIRREINKLTNTLNKQLIKKIDKNLIIAPVDYIPADVAAKEKRVMLEYQAGLITENEYRIAVGYKPIPGGDIKKPSPMPMTPDTAPQFEEEPEKKTEPVKKKSLTADRIQVLKAFDEKAEKTEDGYKKAIERVSKDQEKKILADWERWIESGEDPEDALEKSIKENLGLEADQTLYKNLLNPWLTSMQAGAKLAGSILGTTINFNLFNPAFTSWIYDHGLKQAKGINGTTAENLRSTLAAAIENGENQQVRAQLLKGVFTQLSDTRSMLIARTESATTVNFGQLATYKAEGIKKKEWLSAGDSDVRAWHDTRQIVGIDDEFTLTDPKTGKTWNLRYPGDPAGGPENACNCRCTILPVLED